MTALEFYLSLPWTIERHEREDDGERTIVLNVRELDFSVVGKDEADVEAKFWPALSFLLESYVLDGQAPPLPAAVTIADPDTFANAVAEEAARLRQADQPSEAVIATVSLAGMFGGNEVVEREELEQVA